MTDSMPRRLWSPGSVLLVALLAGSGLLPGGAGALQRSQEPDLDALEAQFEEAFAKALEMDDGRPMHVLQAWGLVIESATVLEHVRAQVEAEASGSPPGRPDPEAVIERVLNRWQRLRPDSGGPDLFRAFRIQDPDGQRAAVVALLDRYPDDLLIAWQASLRLRQAGEARRATEVLEAFQARHPERLEVHRLLVALHGALDNRTQRAEALEAWARATPEDPELVLSWLRSSQPRLQPDATVRLLERFFASRPGGMEGLRACREAERSSLPGLQAEARACVARLAADPDAPAEVAEGATAALVAMAAADGDWSGLLAALEALGPEERVRATLGAVHRLEVPERCAERVELLDRVRPGLPRDRGLHRAVAAAAFGCTGRPDAQALFLDLLADAPADQASHVIGAWAVRVGGVPRGELPTGAAQVLERRLVAEAEAPGLYQALDQVYEIDDPQGRRWDLLRRWYARSPDSMSGEQVTALALETAWAGDEAGAIEVLERRIEGRPELEVAELLWSLYRQGEGGEQAEWFDDRLLASDDASGSGIGHLLAGHSAAAAGDPGTAERHYRQALESAPHLTEAAVAILATVARQEGQDRVPDLARRLCREHSLTGVAAGAGCAADLVARASGPEAMGAMLAQETAELPEDVRSLRALADRAEAAGRFEVAERALRRMIEIDPLGDGGWTGLAGVLGQQGEIGALEELLVRARRELPAPPSSLLRAAGRAHTERGDPWRAIELLQEARQALPAESGVWLAAELRDAYAALGRTLPVPTAGPPPAPAPPPESPPSAELEGATAAELLAAAEALQDGSGGRYDPARALELFERAAATGDPEAAYRLALLRRLGGAADRERAEALYRRSAAAVEARAAQGDAYARYLVGTAALVGLEGPEDPAAARRWLELAAPQGQGWAWHNLAWMRENALGYEEADPEAALDAYRRASSLGNVVSMLDFARLTLSTGRAGPLCQEGLGWLERSAGAGHPRAISFLGKLLYYGRGECVPRAPEPALPWLEAAFAAGTPGGDYDLGLALLMGDAEQRDTARAVVLFEQAAARPDRLAVETLAFLYATGIAVERDVSWAREFLAEAARIGSDGLPRLEEEAARGGPLGDLFAAGIKRLEASATGGDAFAAALLSHLLFYAGGALAMDEERAVTLALQAAAAGEPRAMRILGHAYGGGRGVQRDPQEGIRWWRRGAEAGNTFSMMFYSQVLMAGKEVEQDVEAGLRWLVRAAEAGNWWAASDLGNLYDEGWHGLPRNPEKAARWKRVLAELGDAEARGWLVFHGYAPQ